MASVSKRGQRWCVRWRELGRARQITVRTERAARRLAVEIEDAVERYGRYEPRRPGRATPLDVILEDFILHSSRTHRPRTTQVYAQRLETFRRWLDGSLADVLSYRLLAQYHSYLSDPVTGRHLHRRTPETVRKHIQLVEQLWSWAWRRQARGDYTGIPQPDSLELKRQPPPHRRAPTWADMDALIAVSTGWHRQLYTVLRCTGLRVDSQVLALTWDDVDLDQAMLRIRPELGKSRAERRGRWIPIAPVLVTELATWGRREGWLVPCSRETRSARARDAERAWRRAGVPEDRWRGSAHHCIRAGFRTELKRAGADDAAVRFLLGHAFEGQDDHYLSPDALPLVQAVALVPRIGQVCAIGAQPDRAFGISGRQTQQSDGWRRAMGIEPTERHLSMRPDRF